MYARIRDTVLMIVAASCLLAADAQPQDMLSTPNYVDAWHQSYIMTSPLRNRSKSAFLKKNRRASADSVASTPVVTFERSPQITRKVGERFAKSYEGKIQPELLEAIMAELQSGMLQKKFERMMAGIGFDPHNLVDVMAAYYICIWQIANDDDVSDQQTAAIRDSVAPSLAAILEERKLDDAHKQEVAETHMLLITLFSSNLTRLEQGGDATALARYRDEVYRDVLRQGVDLRRLSVTERGFVTE